MDDVIRDNS